MRANRRRSRPTLLAAAVGSLFLPAAMSSVAQQESADIRGTIKVDVTGSNIRRIEGESGLPVQVMTREELLNGGVQTVQDLLERISANQSFGSTNETLGIGSSVVGYTSASLRGLGAQRTLVLLNGKRLAPYALSGGESVDLSGIPASALERVEILKDGASAVYGTDAIGGVINFILRKDFSGVEVNANYFGTQRGGGNDWRANVTAGYGDLSKDRFNVFVSADYFKQDALKASQRAFSRTTYIPSLGYDNTSVWPFPANILQDPAITYPGVNPTIPNPGGATPASCYPYSFVTARLPNLCSFETMLFVDAIPEAEKTNVVGRLTWQVDRDHQFFAEATYYSGKFTQRIAPTAVLPPPYSIADNTLPPTSPFYPAAFVAGLGGDPSQPLGLLYRTFELGPRTSSADVSQSTLVAGLQGTAQGWDYALSGNWVRNNQKAYLTSGYVSDSALGALLHSGDVNPFGFNSPEVVERMRATQIVGQITDNTASNYGGDLKLARNVFDLPAGPVALAIGIEGRRESLEQANSDAVVNQDIIGQIGTVPSLSNSHRTVWALFGEVNVPIVKSFETNLAVRYDHYSDFGSTTNPKVTLRWQPSQSLVLRGAYGTGFRAPTLSDLYQPLGTKFAGSFDDPIRCPVTGSAYDCHETSEFSPPYRSLVGGNPGLQPEKSRQWNVGVVWQPVAEFSVSADYFWVEVRNLIQFSSDVAIRDHFSALAPTQVVRKPPDANFPDLPGEIDHLIQQPVNLGTLQTSGFDVDLRWRLAATSIGRFSASLNGTYVLDYAVAGLDPDAFPRSAGSRGGIGAISRWRHYATLDWSHGAWAATLANTLQSGYSEPCLEFDVTGCATRNVGAYSVWDVQGRYTGVRSMTLTLGVRNLLDVAPPLSNQTSAFQPGYDPTYADPRGRMFYGAIRYAFP